MVISSVAPGVVPAAGVVNPVVASAAGVVPAPGVVPIVVVSPGVVSLGVGAADVDGTPVVVDVSATLGNSYYGISFPQHAIYFIQTRQTNNSRMESILMQLN